MSRIKEISKSKIATYLQRVPAASASAGNAMSASSPRKAQAKGVKDFLKRVRGTNMSVDKMTGKAKVPATESFIIPEDIPFKERNAFMGAAAAAHKSGKSHFNFGGKKHPVTIDKKVATKIADQKESMDDNDNERLVTMKKNPKRKSGETATMNPKLGTSEKGQSEMEQKEEAHPMFKDGKKVMVKTKADHDKYAKMGYTMKESIRDKLIAVLESDRAAHYKGATEPETMDDKLSGAGAKKMKADMEKGMTPNDTLKKAFDDVTKAGQAGPSMKARPNDKKDGDKKMPTPDDITKKAGMKEEAKRDSLAGIKAAYTSMMEK